MKIEDIINLTDGVLTNTPSVHAVNAATVYSSKVEQGDLFFSSNQKDIDKAIEHGAYAIVYEGTIEKHDNEVAWIEVSNLELAAFKLLRYVALKKEAKFFLLKPYEYTYLKMVLTHKNSVTFIANEWRKAFEQILNGNAFLFVGTQAKLIEMIRPEIPTLTEMVDGKVITDTLFKTTFKVDNYVYQEKEMAPFHLEYLRRVVSFCEKHELAYSLESIKYTKHYQPLFIDNNLHTTPKGKSDKVTIFTDNLEDIVEAREYIRHSNTWVKSIVLTPPKTKVEGVDRPHWFESEAHLRDILKNTHFNYAFIYNANKGMLQSMKEEVSLF
jgi:hypothetical protein